MQRNRVSITPLRRATGAVHCYHGHHEDNSPSNQAYGLLFAATTIAGPGAETRYCTQCNRCSLTRRVLAQVGSLSPLDTDQHAGGTALRSVLGVTLPE